MSDFEGAKIIRTHRDNETKIILVDGASSTTATKKLTIIEAGVAYVAGTNDFGVVCMGKDAGGDSIILPVPLPITDNGGTITVDGTVSISGSVTVTATDLDIRTLDHATPGDSVKVGDGTDFLAIRTNGSIDVNIAEQTGKVFDYQTSATVGINNAVTHFYTITDTKTFIGKTLLVGAKGGVKVRFGLSADGIALTTVKGVYFQNPKENIDHNIEMLAYLGDSDTAIFVEITNTDGATSDVYSSLQGYEV